MKRLLCCLCLVCLLLTAVSADILWEPYDDPNYDYEKANTIARIYYVPEGSTVNLYASPAAAQVLETLEPGTRVYVGFTQTHSGKTWAVGYPLTEDSQEGWFRLARLQLEYDHELFMEEFDDIIEHRPLDFPITDLEGDIPTWTYPGSGISDGVLELQWMNEDYNEGNLSMSMVYTDPAGGQWGYVGYYMGHCGWAYLTDLYAEAPPTFPRQAENTVTDTAEETTSMTYLLPLAAALVIITGTLIYVLKKRTKP